MSASLETNRAWPIASIVILLGLGAINVFLSLFIVPKFEQIYQDALPGMPLPELTVFIIAARLPLALVALAWPIAGIITVKRQQSDAFWIIKLGCLYFFLLIGITIFALFIPMGGGIIVGMSEAPLTSAVSNH
jgi:type II secretory pathway component PulF